MDNTLLKNTNYRELQINLCVLFCIIQTPACLIPFLQIVDLSPGPGSERDAGVTAPRSVCEGTVTRRLPRQNCTLESEH